MSPLDDARQQAPDCVTSTACATPTHSASPLCRCCSSPRSIPRAGTCASSCMRPSTPPSRPVARAADSIICASRRPPGQPTCTRPARSKRKAHACHIDMHAAWTLPSGTGCMPAGTLRVPAAASRPATAAASAASQCSCAPAAVMQGRGFCGYRSRRPEAHGPTWRMPRAGERARLSAQARSGRGASEMHAHRGGAPAGAMGHYLQYRTRPHARPSVCRFNAA